MDVFCPGLAGLSFQGRHERRGLAADEGPAAAVNPDFEVETGVEDVLAQEPVRPALLQTDGQILHRQGIFVPHVDIPLVGPDGESPDDHPLDHAVGVALHDGPVHERPGVPFVSVADHVSRIPVGFLAGSPFPRGGKPAPPAPPQPGLFHGGDDLLGGHGCQSLAQGGVSAVGDVLPDIGGVDPPVVPEGDADLVFIERNLVVTGDLLLALGVLVEQTFDRVPLDQGLSHDLRRIFDRDPLVENLLRVNGHQGTPLAEPVASGLFQGYLPIQPLFLHLPGQGLDDLLGAVGQAPGSPAYGDFRMTGLQLR